LRLKWYIGIKLKNIIIAFNDNVVVNYLAKKLYTIQSITVNQHNFDHDDEDEEAEVTIV